MLPRRVRKDSGSAADGQLKHDPTDGPQRQVPKAGFTQMKGLRGLGTLEGESRCVI